MNVKGAKLWNDRDVSYKQSNNAEESFLRALGFRGWLETCGSTSFIMCMAALGEKMELARAGLFIPQPEDVATLYFNDPRNFDRFRRARPNLEPGTWPGNRVPQYFPEAAADLYGIHATYVEGMAFEAMGGFLADGRTVEIQLRKPAHYVAAVAYDLDACEIIYNDPWPEGRTDGNGFNLRMGKAEYLANVHPFCVVYKPKGA
jgi:hypothetical protein